MVGRVLAQRYRVLEPLGAGGMGVVYLARDERLERDVALKVLPSETTPELRASERFRHEALTLSKLNHPNIDAIYDFDVDDGTAFLVMEYVKGTTLASKLAAAGPLPWRELVTWGGQIAEALQAAHEQGIIHRDLKPANVMVTDTGRVKVLDFGLAKLLRSERESTTLALSLTQPDVAVGTPLYMAPEQLLGEAVDERADVYALGVTLFEMSTGRPPFRPGPGRTLASEILHGQPTEPSSLNPALPAALDPVILRCLEKDPRARYATAAEVAAEFRRLSEPDAQPSARPAAPRAARPAARRGRALWIAAGLTIAALGAGAMLWMRGRGPELVRGRVLVAPLENRTGDPGLDPVGRMAADWIGQGLARTGIVELASPPGSSAASEPEHGYTSSRARALAREAGAGTLVSGAYYREADTLRFDVRVSDTRNGKILRAVDPVSGAAQRPERAVETLRQRVTGVLAVLFNPRLASYAAVTSEPPSLAAYEEYSAGEERFIRRDFEGAIEHYGRAASLDSAYTLPSLQAAVSYWYLSRNASAESILAGLRRRNEELAPLDRLRLASLTARVRGDLLADYEAVSQLVRLAPQSGWSYAQATAALRLNRPREAVEILTPVDPEHGWYKGWSAYWTALTAAYHMLGDHERELTAARRGRRQYPEALSLALAEARAMAALGRTGELDQVARSALSLGAETDVAPGDLLRVAALELKAHGHAAAADDFLRRALAWYRSRPPDESRTEHDLAGYARTLRAAERWQEADSSYLRLTERAPENLDYQEGLAASRLGLGDREGALAIDRGLATTNRPYLNGSSQFARARIASLLGDPEAAVRLLREAHAQGRSYDVDLHVDPDLRPLYDFAPFQEWLRPKG